MLIGVRVQEDREHAPRLFQIGLSSMLVTCSISEHMCRRDGSVFGYM